VRNWKQLKPKRLAIYSSDAPRLDVMAGTSPAMTERTPLGTRPSKTEASDFKLIGLCSYRSARPLAFAFGLR